MKRYVKSLFFPLSSVLLLILYGASTTEKENTKTIEKSESEYISPSSTPNDNYIKAILILQDPVFLDNISKIDKANNLSDEEKSNLNNIVQPLIRKAITLLRKAYAEMPSNAEVNFEMVKCLYLDYIRILKIGTRNERLQIIHTGFKGLAGEWIDGYPNMIKYHASECIKNDFNNRYKPDISKILEIVE